MAGLRNDEYPLVRLATGFANWMAGINGLNVYTACAADPDGQEYPASEPHQLEFDSGTYPQTELDSAELVVLSQQNSGEITLYSFKSFDEPNMTADGGTY